MGQLEDMAMFARIVEAGSMSRVAEQTGIARSAVSRRLAALEQSLNTQLLVRNTRNSTLTDAGSSFYERAKQILADVQELNSETSGSQTQLDGDLRIAAPVSFGLLHLSGVVNEFADKYPALSLHLDFNDRQVDLIEEGLDLAIRIADLKDSDYLARKIATIRRVLCASPEYLEAFGSPIAPKDLAAHRILGYTNTPTSSWLMEDPNGRRIRVNPPVTISAITVITCVRLHETVWELGSHQPLSQVPISKEESWSGCCPSTQSRYLAHMLFIRGLDSSRGGHVVS